MHMELKPKFEKLKAEIMEENGFTSSTKVSLIREKMYAKNPRLVVKFEWLRVKSRPMFSKAMRQMLIQPVVFHGGFALVSKGWFLCFVFMDRKSLAFFHFKEKIIGLDGWDALKSYLNCQNLTKHTHEYVTVLVLSFFSLFCLCLTRSSGKTSGVLITAFDLIARGTQIFVEKRESP